MGLATGIVTQQGYQKLGTPIFVTNAGMGFGISDPPSLPLNPYYGYVYLAINNGASPMIELGSAGRKIYRDGVIVFPPYPDANYQVIVIWSSAARGRSWVASW